MIDNRQVTKVVAASLLGDAHISWDKRSKQGNGGFELSQVQSHRDHLERIANYIEHITPVVYSTHEFDTRQTMVRLRSKLHPFYTKFRERMYPNGHKVVDPHYLTLLDWEFLAIWFVEDGWHTGALHKEKYFQHQVAIASQSFSYAENMLLRRALKETLDLDWNVRAFTGKNGRLYRLHLATKDIDKMLESIAPFVPASFTYKIDKQQVYQRIISNRMLSPATAGGDIVSST